MSPVDLQMASGLVEKCKATLTIYAGFSGEYPNKPGYYTHGHFGTQTYELPVDPEVFSHERFYELVNGPLTRAMREEMDLLVGLDESALSKLVPIGPASSEYRSCTLNVEGQDIRLKELGAEVTKLRNAIRAHRDEKGHDRCWLDDQELYKALPEGLAEVDQTLPPKEEFIANCHRYHAHRQDSRLSFIRQKDSELEIVLKLGYRIELFGLLAVSQLNNGQFAVDEENVDGSFLSQTLFPTAKEALDLFLKLKAEKRLGYEFERGE